MKFERAGGILLHPTCLPGPYGIGDIGPGAIRWLEFLSEAGCNLWQILPLGPTGYGDSPYQCFSSFAGNPYLISPEALLENGLLSTSDLEELPEFAANRVDYGKVIHWKLVLLNKAYDNLKGHNDPVLLQEFAEFQEQKSFWLADYALFMALKEMHQGKPWFAWDVELRDRDPQAIENFKIKFTTAIERHTFWQFLFFRQWRRLRERAIQCGIQIIGDIPIFVAHDSSDVWTNRELFHLDEDGMPTYVAGVPPDYFSKTGQLWGNPLYRWDVHASQGYTWWLERLRSTLALVDIVRLDHFRGFAGYWEVPGDAETAEFGRWAPGPGRDFFVAMQKTLGELPIIAEDLGMITPDVVDLLEEFGFPGMKILQFGFDGNPLHPFLPHNYPKNCVVYTGTHDNDTVRGWYRRIPQAEKKFFRRYLNRNGRQVSWDLIRACWASVAIFALAPMQDFLDLGNEARMNYPGSLGDNWAWRMKGDELTGELAGRIRELNYLYSR